MYRIEYRNPAGNLVRALAEYPNLDAAVLAAYRLVGARLPLFDSVRVITPAGLALTIPG